MMKEVGRKISESRKIMGISQIEFAKNLNISNATLSQYESGDINIPLQKIVEISKILNVTPNYLLGFEEKENYQMNNYDLLEKIENLRNSVRINVEQGTDKLNNIIIPILKNNIDDIVILDIDGKAYKKTEKYRRVVLQNKISKIDLFDDITESFNPFHYLNFESSNNFIETIVNLYLNENNSNKSKFLKGIIINLFFKSIKNKEFKISFPIIYDFINELGVKKSIISDLDLLSSIIKIEKINEKLICEYYELKKKFYVLKKELINLGEEKLIDLKNELLQDLKIFSNETIRKNTIQNTIELPICDDVLNDFSKTIYFIVDEDKIEKLAPLIRIFYYLILLKKTEVNFWDCELEDKRKNYNKLTIIMDNFVKIGKHITLEKTLGFIGGYNINCIIFANRNDLKNIYGENNGIFSNTDILKLSKNKMEYIYKDMKSFDIYKSTIFIKNDDPVNENDINNIDEVD